jgi:hypothetical protein
MEFYWNAFGVVNLLLDLAIVGIFFLFIFFNARLQPSKNTFAIVRQAALADLLLWVLCGLFVGGIVGVALIARTFWTLFTVAMPLLLTFYAINNKKRLFLVPALLLMVCKYYGEVFEPSRLEVEHAVISVKGLKESVRIAHISDLQTDGLRGMHGKVLAAVNGYAPDFIVFTGDVMNHPSLQGEIGAYLHKFKSRHGSFFVSGNVDHLPDMREFISGAGFEDLDRNYRKIKLPAGNIGVVGLGLEDFSDQAVLKEMLGKLGKTDATILLSHLPDTLRIAQGLPVTVQFSGHTHGGQVCLPFFGPVLTLSHVARAIAAGGVHKVGGLYVVVSRGLGMEGHVSPRVRAFCRPHLILLELKPE